MHKNKFLIGAGIAILFILSLLIALKSMPSNKTQQGTQPQNAQQHGDVISIPVSGGQVTVTDVTKNPVEQTDNTFVAVETPDYHLVYFASDKAFLITILSQPAQQARDKAEAAFLQKLQISQADACKLKVSLMVPFSVDENLSGKDYGLSFCSNGVSF